MHNKYYDSGSVAVAVNFKVASASLARAVIKAHHPEMEAGITTHWTPGFTGPCVAYPEGRNAENMRWQTKVPKVDPDEKPVLLLMRDPVEKFRSACAEDKITDVNRLLNVLEAGTPENWEKLLHFWPQCRFLQNVRVKAYRIERDLEQFCADAGLEYPMSWIGPAGHNGAEKPDLTIEQVNRVKAIYADDYVLYDSTVDEAVDADANEDADPTRLRERMRRTR